ncbi:hypothetical protein NEMIN01_1168 [Nematocida minor]|uniref:uncharacterized protein n=1 Tax=Nematocida minor TaxID=1912983 RepID=UPI00222118D1|nr:uncharacterized protein NEMIN01_1168 [Nematocida minor]KAI5190703.1 hypothetical protein NEMIN01_1168 [Nematocida minor]
MDSMEIWTGYFNLLKTIMGAGIVSYPLFFVEFGVVTATILSCFSSLLTFSSLMMLCECADYSKSKSKTFSSVLSKVWPNVAGMFNAVVFSKCFGVSVSYLVLLQPLLQYIFNLSSIQILHNMKYAHITLLYALIMLPICTMKDLRSLRFTSIIGVIGVYICIAGSIYNYVIIKESTPRMPATSLFNPPSYSWIGFAGQFIFSFTCHQNIFGIRANLTNPSIKSMRYIVALGLGTALLLYIIFGVVVYLSYGSSIEDNVFNSFIDGPVKRVVFIFYTIFISCSFPLQVHPARDCVTDWMAQIWPSTAVTKGTRPISNSTMCRIGSTAAIIALSASLSLLPVGLSTIQTAIGGSASSIMCNFIPAICLMKLPRKKTGVEKTCAILLVAYGLLAFTGVFIKIAGNRK